MSIMSKFSTAFGLCSITDSKCLLGVSDDDDGCVVITLGRSMIIRCRVSDQKQLNSWSTTLAKLTSKVVWNAEKENYVGVFDDIYLKQWTINETNLEKVKKHKFKNEIYEVLVTHDSIIKRPKLLILFKNGSIRDLESAIRNNKEDMKEILNPLETIESAKIIVENTKNYLIIVTKFENKYRQCYSIALQDNDFLVSDSIKKIKLRRPGTSLLGFTILSSENGNSLLTYWSDGFLYTLSIPLESEKSGVGKYLGAINLISKKSEVAIQAVGHDHVAMYGGDISEEGAFLGIYNVKFGVVQAQTSFKMFNKPPRMWLFDNNKLAIVMGQRLVCVPFNLQTETLSALVGSRALHDHLQTPSEICTILPTAVWEENEEDPTEKKFEVPNKIKEQLITFLSEGWSEYGICQALMGQLIDAKDMTTLLWCLNNFSDIPENHLVRMIQLVLRDFGNELFQKKSSETTSATNSFDDNHLNKEFLNKILRVPVDSFNLLTNLKRLLTFDDCLTLINHLSHLFAHADKEDVPVEDSTTVLEWTMTLLDAFYQYFILSRDAKVLESVKAMKKQIEEMVAALNELSKVSPYLISFQKGKLSERKRQGSSYSVERFRLYY